MLLVDAHLDLAWNALQWNRDLLQSAYTIRTLEAQVSGKGRAQNTVALPQMRQGKVALCFATLLARSTGTAVPHLDYPTPYQAYAAAHGQLAYYDVLQQEGEARIITDAPALNQHLEAWRKFDADPDAAWEDSPPLGLVISMEGADPILHPQQLNAWWEKGLRLIGITHFGGGRYAGGTGKELGLSEKGFALLHEIERLGMMLDLTHCDDRAFWQVMDRFQGPVMASHNNCRALVPHQRQFSDEQIKAIIQRKGIIGVAFDCWMLEPGWIVNESRNHRVFLDTVVNHMDHICQLAGNCKHVGMGSDLDGGFGREQSPCDLDTIADLQKMIPLLEDRGYTTENIQRIFHENWLHFLIQNWT